MNKLIGSDIKAVLFDHDDTLVGTIEAKWSQHKHIAKKYYNKHLLDKEIKEHWGKPFSMLLGLLYETEDIDLAMQRVLKIHKDFPKKLFDSTIGVLEKLRQEGKFVGVITSSTRSSWSYDIESLGIPEEFFDFKQTEDDTQYHKPDPRVFDPAKEWLAGHGIKNNEVVYIGDSLIDFQAASSAGFNFIGVTTGIISAARFKKAGARSTVKNLSELLK